MSVIPRTAERSACDWGSGPGSANRYGHFSADGRAYCITDPRTPRPWCNIIANPRFGLAVSQAGSGFTWIDNSQLAVLTRWQQDFAHDASGKFIYVRDLDTNSVWSLTPAPVWPAYETYECRHGFGYTTFITSFAGIRAEWQLSCDPDKAVEYWQVRLQNTTRATRRLELTSYLEWNCGLAPAPRREFHKLFLETEFDAARGVVFATSRMWDVPTARHGHWNADFPYVCGFAGTEPVAAAQGDKGAFFGRNGHLAQPAALDQDAWQPRFGRHEDAIAAMRNAIELPAGASKSLGFTLVVGGSRAEAAQLIDDHCRLKAMDAALRDTERRWSDLLGDHRVDTPDPSVNAIANDWLRYQAISARLWGRCGYYQQSGAFGFRDQLQDAQVWLTIAPDRCRAQINLHAQHQFTDGSVYHWWHPLSEQGLTTTMTDDLLWLGFVAASYIRETNDYSVLDDPAPFVDDSVHRPLREHIARAFARVFSRTSARGLPLIGAGDWNDGLSAAGLQERGESIWLGHFLVGLLADWEHILRRNGEETQAADFAQRRSTLIRAINEHGWDGEWYARATLDDGSKIGSRDCDQGRIFLNAQTWAILNEVAPSDRAVQCWNAVCEHLVTDVGALLLTPAYADPNPAIGYITRYAPGLRENGGVYTHAATWAIAAAAKMGDAARVEHLLDAINPANKDPERYRAEPYVLPGNVDGPSSPYFGRGGWTWYTGSAAWLHRVISEWVLGVRPTWDGLLIAPCLPTSWSRAAMTRPWRGCTYEISIERSDAARSEAVNRGTPRITVDGAPLESGIIPAPVEAGCRFSVHVEVE